MKHLSEDITFEQLLLKLQVEEDNRQNEKTDALPLEPNANMVEGSTLRQKFPKLKRKQSMTKRPFQSAKGPTRKSCIVGYVGNQVIEPRITDIGAIMAVLVEPAVEEPVGL